MDTDPHGPGLGHGPGHERERIPDNGLLSPSGGRPVAYDASTPRAFTFYTPDDRPTSVPVDVVTVTPPDPVAYAGALVAGGEGAGGEGEGGRTAREILRVALPKLARLIERSPDDAPGRGDPDMPTIEELECVATMLQLLTDLSLVSALMGGLEDGTITVDQIGPATLIRLLEQGQ